MNWIATAISKVTLKSMTTAVLLSQADTVVTKGHENSGTASNVPSKFLSNIVGLEVGRKVLIKCSLV